MRKPDLFDLYVILNRRGVSLNEWLDFHEINSIKEFNEKGERIATEQGCYISDKMRADTLPLVEVRAMKTFQKVVDMAQPLITESAPENKKKRANKKNSSQESATVIVSETSESPTIEEISLDKENLDENRKP
jgi:hypothetical protein